MWRFIYLDFFLQQIFYSCLLFQKFHDIVGVDDNVDMVFVQLFFIIESLLEQYQNIREYTFRNFSSVGRFVPCAVLCVGRFVVGRFELGPFRKGLFCMCIVLNTTVSIFVNIRIELSFVDFNYCYSNFQLNNTSLRDRDYQKRWSGSFFGWSKQGQQPLMFFVISSLFRGSFDYTFTRVFLQIIAKRAPRIFLQCFNLIRVTQMVQNIRVGGGGGACGAAGPPPPPPKHAKGGWVGCGWCCFGPNSDYY